jgi:4-aminobutyrate aminotransferase-like enzyme/Ser/Thr protein kinase RdoA (MazF antagonist)
MERTSSFVGRELRTPRLDAAAAADIARTKFGVEGTVTELGSHQDRNFLVAAGSVRYVLKVANAAFTRDELDLQNRAMEHTAFRVPHPVPAALPGVDGESVVAVEHEGASYHVRLLTFLEGSPLVTAGYLAANVLRATGGLAGRVAAALSSFDHPALDRLLQWDVRRAVDVVAAYAPLTEDGQRRRLAEHSVAWAAAKLERLDASLRRQAIHGDVTDWNVLAERDGAGRPTPCGLIDFGDMTRSWLAAECAVLAAAMASRALGSAALRDAAQVVRGFHAVLPLREDEIAALPALLTARATLSAVSGEHQAALEPDNRYVVASVERGWRGLETIAAIPEALAQAVFRQACGLPVPAPRRRRWHDAGPVVEGLGQRRAVAVDLSVRTDDLRHGGWRQPAAIKAAVARAEASCAEGLAVGRHGEARIVVDEEPGPDEPETAHLGADLFLPEQTVVLAPLDGRVLRCEATGMLLAVDDGFMLRLAGVVPAATAGDDVRRGQALGRVARPGADQRLPAHLHVQLAGMPLDRLPGLVPASLSQAWLSLCPDPGPLLGLDVAAPSDPTQSVLKRRRRFVASPQRLYYAPTPRLVERGWRQWLYDIDGRRYLDMINNIAIVGHSHPRVEEAAARQLRLLNTNTRFLYDAMGRFAERLAGLVPPPLEVVFLLNSGSEANDLALRLAREVTGRRDVVCLDASYHGWTSATTHTATATRGRDSTAAVHPLPKPAFGDDAATLAARLDASLQAIGDLVSQRRAPAAFISEPLLGNSGGLPLPPGYLRALYKAVRDAEGLCIADEVQVGYGRLGAYFWAFQQQGVVPDIVTIAKSAGNGHPVAAVITTRAIADTFGRANDLFSSVGGGPVSCEVGLAVLDVLQQEQLQRNAREVGDYLTERLTPLVDANPLAGALHGLGLYRGIELIRDGDPRSPATAEAAAVCERLLELGVVVQPTGAGANILKLKPPLCVTRADIDVLAGALGQVFDGGW